MVLEVLIDMLERHPREKRVRWGFGKPHSYRGYYEDLAFEPVDNTTVGEMLDAARSAMGKTFEGYKGGDYKMGGFTECWLSCYGTTGEGIGPVLLRYMLSCTCSDEG